MNPILPPFYYIPDVEGRQWEDGRMYIYGSHDICGNTNYCSHKYRVFSSDNLIDWQDHGISFISENVRWSNATLYAPDCIYRNGIYYLYFCMADNSEGVAESRYPYGPFKNAKPIEGANKDAIDPAVFVDDDGEIYYYWGQFKARGARLKGMTKIDKETLNTNLLDEKEHGFHEGISIRKRNGIYYAIYTDISRGKASCISYATSKSPLGPFKKGGIIIDNIGCDPQTWNNHGSISEFNGKWYIFYHRSSQGSKFSRRVCMEPINFNEDGSINEVEMTTQGISEPIKAISKIDAYRACLLSGKIHTEVEYLVNHHIEYLAFIENNDWAAYKYINFESGVSKFEIKASTFTSGGIIELRIDSIDGPIIGECYISSTNGWNKWKNFSCAVDSSVRGVHALYLIFKNNKNSWGRLFNVKSFEFKV
uniref:Carbohydrate-binding protein n=1 Tax=candidate division WOR-3 bacterium TaxID=2052148 RepID=A0A7C6AF20_UNCW3